MKILEEKGANYSKWVLKKQFYSAIFALKK